MQLFYSMHFKYELWNSITIVVSRNSLGDCRFITLDFCQKRLYCTAEEGGPMRKMLPWGIGLFMMMVPLTNMAQELNHPIRLYKPFKVDVGISLTFPANTGLTAGGGFFVEPR